MYSLYRIQISITFYVPNSIKKYYIAKSYDKVNVYNLTSANNIFIVGISFFYWFLVSSTYIEHIIALRDCGTFYILCKYTL